MEDRQLYQLIELQPEVVQRLEEIKRTIRLAPVEVHLERMTDIRTAPQAYQDLSAYFSPDDGQFQMLYCQLECARRQYEQYRKKGIADDVFADTMKCFPRFLEERHSKTGEWAFDRGWWTYRQLSMTLFRVGALEYQLDEAKGEKVIAVHIPSDADFSHNAVSSSFSRAEVFIQHYYPAYGQAPFTCRSWLLSPMLQELLPEDSNILSFQHRFVIFKVDREDKGFLEWLFRVPPDTPYEVLPEHTRLQRNAKRVLLAGGFIGAAYGIIKNR